MNIRHIGIILGIITFCVITTAFLIPGPIQRESYMGAQYCGSCHQEEYKAWESSNHAKALVHLPNNMKDNRACLSCHATGVFEKHDPVFAGVQCESCHGPGQHYAALHIKKDAKLSNLLFMRDAKQSCKQCHINEQKFENFHVEKNHKFDHGKNK